LQVERAQLKLPAGTGTHGAGDFFGKQKPRHGHHHRQRDHEPGRPQGHLAQAVHRHARPVPQRQQHAGARDRAVEQNGLEGGDGVAQAGDADGAGTLNLRQSCPTSSVSTRLNSACAASPSTSGSPKNSTFRARRESLISQLMRARFQPYAAPPASHPGR
jgi:hypothetical protein